MPQSNDIVNLAVAVSWLCGWIYFLAWSGSFYPQPLKNFKRKSVKGTAIDFPTINTLGFASYTLSTAAFLFSPVIKHQYAERHPASPKITVRINDLVFAAHGLVLCLITYSQFFPRIWGFEVSKSQQSSPFILGVFWGCILAVIMIACIIWLDRMKSTGSQWASIDCVYALGYVKLVATLVKYCPQVYLNYQRKSTKGWSIWQILLDFIGGILSLLQLIIDSALQNDWSGVYGNPAKLGLSNVSMFFDVIFITQHYILYRRPAPKDGEARERQALVDEESALLQHSHRST